jgi:hypothetical protein
MLDKLRDNTLQTLLAVAGVGVTHEATDNVVLAGGAGLGGVVVGLLLKLGQQLIKTLAAQQESQARIEHAFQDFAGHIASLGAELRAQNSVVLGLLERMSVDVGAPPRVVPLFSQPNKPGP